MKGQSLETVSRASRRIWSATRSRAGYAESCARTLSTVVSAVSTTSALSVTKSATCSPDQTCQSLPEPHELGGSSTGEPTKPLAIASDRVPTRTPAAGSARRTRPSHSGPSCHQCPNSSVSKAATTWAGRPVRSASEISRRRTVCTKSATCASMAAAARSGSYGAFDSDGTVRPVTRAGLRPVRWS